MNNTTTTTIPSQKGGHQQQIVKYSRHRPLASRIMTPINSSSSTRNTPHHNHSTPGLRPHPQQTSFSHDKLTPRINLQHVIPVIFLNVLDVSYATARAGIGHKYRDGFMFSADNCV